MEWKSLWMLYKNDFILLVAMSAHLDFKHDMNELETLLKSNSCRKLQSNVKTLFMTCRGRRLAHTRQLLYSHNHHMLMLQVL